MTILSFGKDTLRVASGGWIYEYYGLNPYVINRIFKFRKHGDGRAWQLLKKYSFEKESIDDYNQRHVDGHRRRTALVLQ